MGNVYYSYSCIDTNNRTMSSPRIRRGQRNQVEMIVNAFMWMKSIQQMLQFELKHEFDRKLSCISATWVSY